ncbi:Glycoprotein-polysaccharide metabolism [Cronobacter sakazakii 701]|nr:Glycoprotein-polysaccharide metabolism [Cronobacter sakazakii 701]
MFITDRVQPAVNEGGTKIDLTLVPVQQTAVPVQSGGGAVTSVPSTSPTQVTPSSAVPAPTTY